MERVRIAALFADKEQYGGASVTVCGWAKTIRDMKTFGFIELNDGSCFRNLQVVMDANSLSNYKEIAAQNVGAALIVRGTVVLTPEAKQPLEVKATEIEIEGVSSPDYPLQKKRHSVEYLRTIQHLRPRTNLFSAAFRVRSAAAYAVHEFFQSRGFVYVNTPIITGDVPGHDAGSGEPAENARRQGRLQQGLFRQEDEPDRLRPAQRRDVCAGLPQHLYLRTDLPCRKFQHDQTCSRVLDDRAGDRICRFRG